jgi:hypothetical protein
LQIKVREHNFSSNWSLCIKVVWHSN